MLDWEMFAVMFRTDCIKVYTFNDVWVVYCAPRRVVGHITTFLR